MKNKNNNNTNIFQGAGLLTECVHEWDKQLRLNEWVDTDVFADVFHFDTIHYEKEEAYKQKIKDAKTEIRRALAERGMSLRDFYSGSHNMTARPSGMAVVMHRESGFETLQGIK